MKVEVEVTAKGMVLVVAEEVEMEMEVVVGEKIHTHSDRCMAPQFLYILLLDVPPQQKRQSVSVCTNEYHTEPIQSTAATIRN